MDLTTLAQEYFQQEQEVRKMIIQRKSVLKNTDDPSKVMEIKRKIQVLYTMARDCHSIGIYLNSYYNGDDN